jgi:hypothetical protein
LVDLSQHFHPGNRLLCSAKAAAYVDAYMQNINWADVAQRYQRAAARS